MSYDFLTPNPQLTPDEIEDWRVRLNVMSEDELIRLRRFAPCGHEVFRCDLPLYDLFVSRLRELGGGSPEASKRVGWDGPSL